MSQDPSSLRQRPQQRKWRRRVLLTLLFLMLLLGGGILYFLWSSASDLRDIMAEIDRQDPGWRLDEIEARRKTIPDAENSALHIMAIKKQLLGGQSVWIPAMDKMFENLPSQVQLNEQQADFLRGRFEVLKKATAAARKLKDMPDGRFPINYSADFFSTLLNCQEARSLCEVLQWDAALRAHDFDADGAMESCLALQHTARSLGDEPLLISQLVRNACNAITVNAIERTLAQAQGPPTEASLKRMQTALARELQEATFLIAVRGERAGLHQLLQGLAEGKVNAKSLGDPVEAAMLERFPGYLTRQHAAMLRYLNKVLEAAKLPPEEKEERFQALEKTIKDEPRMVRLLTPAFNKVREADRRTQANLGCAWTALAAERFRLAKNQWPESLEALVKAGFLDAVPKDLYDGKPLRLKRTIDGLIVYSVGLDRIDNDGNINRERPTDPGTDLGFQLWDIRHRRQPANPPVEENENPLK